MPYFVFGRDGDIDVGGEYPTAAQAFSYVARTLARPSPYDGRQLSLSQFTVVHGEKIDLTLAKLPKVPLPAPNKPTLDRHARAWSVKYPTLRLRIARAVDLVDDVSLLHASVARSYRVPGSQGTKYTVTLAPPQPSCDCADASQKGNVCKHMIAVALYVAATGGQPAPAGLLQRAAKSEEPT